MKTTQPEVLSRPKAKPLVLDVRPIFEKGGSPCCEIESAVASLEAGQPFVLLVPFEPQPLYTKLGREGFTHSTRREVDGSWRVEFRKEQEGAAPNSPEADGADTELDVRGLEPPGPLVKTLEALTRLKQGAQLRMHSDRKPLHLFEQLESRGFIYDCTEQDDHSFITQIWHGNEFANSPVRH